MKLDNEELELLQAVENSEHFEKVDDFEEQLLDAKVAAKNYLQKTEDVNIKIAEYDLLMLKRRSAELNIPCETILSSLVHQYITNKFNISL
ncbi:MAG: antitoxin [Campylobacterota bacterium]